MTRRARLICALLCAVLSVAASIGYGRSAAARVGEARRYALEEAGYDAVPVLVAKRELSVGERILRSDVEQTDWIAEYVPEGAYASLDDCLDKQLSSAVPAGGVLCEAVFRSASEGQSVPSGYVAINLQLTKNLGIADDCAPGTNAVAYVVGSGTSGVELAAANARVLEVRPASSSMSSDTVTLAVRPDDVAAVVAATRNDSLRLVLPADDVAAIPDPVLLAKTGGGYEERGPMEVPAADAGEGTDTAPSSVQGDAYGEDAGVYAQTEANDYEDEEMWWTYE